MKEILKRAAARVAKSRVVRSSVVHLVYPTIAGCIKDEVRPDVPSQTGVVEDLAWKIHAQIVLNDELRLNGLNCCPDGLRSDKETRARMFEAVLKAAANVPGDILEFGVSSGESMRYWAKHCPDRKIFGFDSFEGLPEEWWTRSAGAFKADVPQIDAPNVEFVKGWFDQSIPPFMARWSGRAAIIHVDCDLFSSTRTCLAHLLPRSGPGTLVVFDEYYNYEVFAEHEWLAWHEAIHLFGMTVRCVAFDGRRAAFQITSMSGAAPG